MLQYILLGILIVDALALTGVILLQRSEGGALGMGGGGGAFLSVRGAGDLLTRTTWILAGIALVICVTITLLMNHDRANQSVAGKINGLNLPAAAAPQQQQTPASSAAPGAPPLPGAAPPLPTAMAPSLPAEAPAPTVRSPQRSAPAPAQAQQTRAPVRVPQINLAPVRVPAAPQPKIDLTAPAPAKSAAPASGSTPHP